MGSGPTAHAVGYFLSHLRCFVMSGERATAERYKEAFKELPAERWKVFKEPIELLSNVQ